MKNMKKILVLALAALLLVAVSVAGTVAYLTAKTDPVTNTFVPATIEIELKEHELQADGTLDMDSEVDGNDGYRLLPGLELKKDPFVRVKQGPCYVFVEAVGSTAPDVDDYILWSRTSGWSEITGVIGPNGGTVYGYADNGTMKSMATGSVTPSIISTISVRGNVTTAMLSVDNIDDLSLSFYAYALQAEGVSADTPAAMWQTYMDNTATTNP